jgi:hypothetical protein
VPNYLDLGFVVTGCVTKHAVLPPNTILL